MVSLFTQYRKHYKGPSWDDFAISEYNRKRDYRIGRRSVEHRHQPWEWNSDSESSDCEANEQIPGQKQAEIFDRKREIRAKKALVKKGLDEGEKSLVKEAWTPEIKDRSFEPKATQTTRRKLKLRKRRRTMKSNDVETFEEKKPEERVPFVSYGWANDAPIERKYTHNVRANCTEVYPASLRALKRRELDIQRKLEENKKKANCERKSLKEKCVDLSSSISPTFMTEYQRSYCNRGNTKTGYVW